MYNITRLNAMYDDIKRFIIDLKDIGLDKNSLDDAAKFHASAMLIFGIINRIIDIAEEVLVKNDLPMPSAYSECFPTLAKTGLLGRELAEKLENLVKERGLFAHHYYDADKNKVLHLTKEIYIALDFIQSIKKIISKQNEKK